jgi:hypothetical protein
MQPADEAYDAFISYRQQEPDGPWGVCCVVPTAAC